MPHEAWQEVGTKKGTPPLPSVPRIIQIAGKPSSAIMRIQMFRCQS